MPGYHTNVADPYLSLYVILDDLNLSRLTINREPAEPVRTGQGN